MQTITAPVEMPVEMPVVHSPLDPEVADKIGDDVLLGAAATNKVQKVKRVTTAGVRGWTMWGGVD